MVVRFLLAIVLAEVLIELAKEALIFEPLRRPFRAPESEEEGGEGQEDREPPGIAERLRWKVGELWECGYCLSVWGGWLSAFVFRLQVGAVEWWPWVPWWVDTLVCGFLVHRASNVLHEGISRWLGRAPLQVLLVRREIAEIQSEGEPGDPDPDISQEEADGCEDHDR